MKAAQPEKPVAAQLGDVVEDVVLGTDAAVPGHERHLVHVLDDVGGRHAAVRRRLLGVDARAEQPCGAAGLWMRGSLSDQDANHLAHLGVLDTARRPVGSGADLALELEQPLRTHATLQAHRIAQQLRAAKSE